MVIAKIIVSGISARAEGCGKIPKGITGGQIALEFTDTAWDNLQKTVVFCGSETRTVLNAGKLVTIPWEVTGTVGVDVMVGICGTDEQGTVLIPTLWAELGKVWGAALPTEDTTTDATLPVWAQLQTMIGDPETLVTENRENLVAAVNEIAEQARTPVRGIDYWTESDQEAIVQQVITALGIPVFGTVDADNTITLTGNLADGTYTLNYEDAAGNLTEIGAIKIGTGCTNLAGTILYDVRLSSSGVTKASAGAAVIDYIPVKRGDMVRVKGLDIINDLPDGNGASMVSYSDMTGTKLHVYYPPAQPAAFIEVDGVTLWTAFTVGSETAGQDDGYQDGVQYYIRLSGTPVPGEEIVVTLNEEIA